MKKDGFTLMELLAVIIIIGILGTVATMGVVNVLNRTSDKNMKQQLQQLQDAAITYAIAKNYYLEICPNDNGAGCTGNQIKVIKVSDLIPQFFEDSAANCKKDGKITLYMDSSYTFGANLEDGICSKA